jgi:short-chain fatty acids transporter
MGLLVWHGGLSGSAPLKVAESGIPLSSTLGSPLNLAVNLGLLAVVPAFLHRLHPRDPATCMSVATVAPRISTAPAPSTGASADVPAPSHTFAGGLENSRVLLTLLVLLGAAGIAAQVHAGRLTPERLALNDVIFIFLFLGLALHGSLRSYLVQVWEGARASAGIILLFPFYAGITGIMQSSGLVGVVSDAFARISDSVTYPVFTFLSAGVVNLFVPSGGGQWAVQGPILMQAAMDAGVSPGRAVLALAYGDQWTNLFQPFWALPLLGITGARAGDILGYTAILGVAVGVVFAVGVAIG